MNVEKRDESLDDYYAVLELDPSASSDDVLEAYDRLRRLFAEDAVATYALFGDGESAEQRKRLDRAFEVLSNDSTRLDYHLRRGMPAPRPSSRQAPTSSSSTSSTSTSMTRPPAEEVTTTQSSKTTVTVKQEVEAPKAADAARVEPAKEEAPVRAEPPKAVEPTREPAKEAPVAARAEEPAPEAPAPTPPTAVAQEPMDDAQYSGGMLSRLRESAGLELQGIAQKTKISLTHLRAIEGNLYDKLPARVYVRGFVSQYARCLGLNPERVADSYLQIYDRYHQQQAQPSATKK